jgi:hypothetical protein
MLSRSLEMGLFNPDAPVVLNDIQFDDLNSLLTIWKRHLFMVLKSLNIYSQSIRLKTGNWISLKKCILSHA